MELQPAIVVATVAQLAHVDPAAITSRTWRRSVQEARIAAAHLLRTRCGLTRAEAARFVGRSDQAVSDFTPRANRSIARDGPIRELITAAETVLCPLDKPEI